MNALRGDTYETYSAGIEPTTVQGYTIKVMGEIGIDISLHRSKNIDEFEGMELDYVVTVCENAKEACPFFPYGKQKLHKGFRDPASAKGTEEERLQVFKEIRDEIAVWITETFAR